MLSAKAAMRNPISPLAIIAVPTIEAGYKERNLVMEAVTCGVSLITQLRGFAKALCEGLSLDLRRTLFATRGESDANVRHGFRS